MSDVISKMNGEVWVFAAILILFVCVQALLFLRLALRFNKKNQLVSKQEISQSAKTGFVSVFGPSISTIVVALSLITMVGSGATFMRCGVIGAPAWELLMANTAAESAGVTLGTAEVTGRYLHHVPVRHDSWLSPVFHQHHHHLKAVGQSGYQGKCCSCKGKKGIFYSYLGQCSHDGSVGLFHRRLPFYCCLSCRSGCCTDRFLHSDAGC